MAREPENIVLIRLNELRDDVRALSQQVADQSKKLDRMEAAHADTERLALLALGAGTDSRLKIRELARRVDEAFGRLDQLEGQP